MKTHLISLNLLNLLINPRLYPRARSSLALLSTRNRKREARSHGWSSQQARRGYVEGGGSGVHGPGARGVMFVSFGGWEG